MKHNHSTADFVRLCRHVATFNHRGDFGLFPEAFRDNFAPKRLSSYLTKSKTFAMNKVECPSTLLVYQERHDSNITVMGAIDGSMIRYAWSLEPVTDANLRSLSDPCRPPSELPAAFYLQYSSSTLVSHRPLIFQAEFEELVAQPCYYCGKATEPGRHYNGLDRIDTQVLAALCQPKHCSNTVIAGGLAKTLARSWVHVPGQRGSKSRASTGPGFSTARVASTRPVRIAADACCWRRCGCTTRSLLFQRVEHVTP